MILLYYKFPSGANEFFIFVEGDYREAKPDRCFVCFAVGEAAGLR